MGRYPTTVAVELFGDLAMNDAFAADTADTLPFTGLTPYGRPSWSGLLQFSLVGIPLKAYPAVRTRDVPSAHLLHADCGERLRYAKHCPEHVRVCPQTVRPPAHEPTEELRLAGMLIEAAGGKVDWTAYPDQGAQELKALIEAKLAGQPAALCEPPRMIVSLLEALQQSVGVPSQKEVPLKQKTPRKRARRTA